MPSFIVVFEMKLQTLFMLGEGSKMHQSGSLALACTLHCFNFVYQEIISTFLLRFRLGGDYGAEFDDLRDQGYRLQELVDHFLMKDEINRQESLRRARLRAQAKIDAEVKLQRRAYKDKWGIVLDYSYR